MKRKRSILLLEVLIAITLVSLCILPLLSSSLFIYTEEKRFSRETELDRLVGLFYSDLLVKFYQTSVSWHAIESAEVAVIGDPRLEKLGYRGSYHFILKARKGKLEESIYALNLLQILYRFTPIHGGKPLEYAYYLFVQRQSDNVEEE